jgi:hypothetical protein
VDGERDRGKENGGAEVREGGKGVERAKPNILLGQAAAMTGR